MKYTLFAVWLVGLCASGFSRAESIFFRQSMMTIPEPVKVHDVLGGELSQQQRNMPWPKTLRGWVSRQEVESWMHQTQPDRQRVWSGPKRAWIRQCYPVVSRELEASVSDVITQQLGEQSLTLAALHSVDKKSPLCLEQRVHQSRVEQVKLWQGSRARVAIVHELENGKVHKEHRQYLVDAAVNAWVITQDVVKGQKVEGIKLKQQSRPFTGKELTKVNGRVALRHLTQGEVITDANTREWLPVMEGERVKVKLNFKSIQVEAHGVSLDNGDIGGSVRVRLDGFSQLSRGKVSAKGVVNVSV